MKLSCQPYVCYICKQYAAARAYSARNFPTFLGRLWSYVDGLDTSHAGLFLASTNPRCYKELDREMLNKRRFWENFLQDFLGSQIFIKGTCPAYFKRQMKLYLLSFVETPRKFIIAELSIRKLGSSSVLIIILLALMKIRAYGSKALQ